MTEGFTVERLRKWGEDLNAESNGLGAHLLRYAEAWEDDVGLLRYEISVLRYQLREAMGKIPTPCEEVRKRESDVLREKLDDVASNCRGKT